MASLQLEIEPGQTSDDGAVETFVLPDTPEKYLVLSLGGDAAENSTSSSVGGEGDTTGGAMWAASVSSANSSEELGGIDWVVFPSSGMLLPGQR